jgi:hypothetical protein
MTINRGGQRTQADPSLFWHDQDLVRDLRRTKVYDDGSNHEAVKVLMNRAADTIARLRDEMIDPGEYMRVSNERGRLFAMLDTVLKSLNEDQK